MAATVAQVDAEIASINASLQNLATLSTTLDADVNALAAKVASGEDFTPELTALQTAASTLATAVTNVQSADTVAVQTTNPPVSAPPAAPPSS